MHDQQAPDTESEVTVVLFLKSPRKSGVMRLFDALPSFAEAAEGILRALRLTASLIFCCAKKIYG